MKLCECKRKLYDGLSLSRHHALSHFRFCLAFGMSKLLFAAATALFAAPLALAATVANTCTVVNFTERTTDFTTLKTIVDLVNANDGTLLNTYLDAYDPYVSSNKTTIEAIDFSLIDLNFELTSTLDYLNLTGLTLVRPYYINVTGDHSLDAGAYFNGDVLIDATFSVEVEQLHRQWYQLCWTSLLSIFDCPAASFTVDVELDINTPVAKAGLDLYMYNCEAGIATSTCSNLTVSSILVAAISGSYSTVLTTIEEHVINATVTSLDVGFGSIKSIDFKFRNTSTLINLLINALLDFSADVLNEKGTIYTTFIGIFDKVFKAVLNNIISLNLQPLFGATCL